MRVPALSAFLAEQRRRRIERVRQMIDRLEAFGISLDVNAIVAPAMAESGRAVGALVHAVSATAMIAAAMHFENSRQNRTELS